MASQGSNMASATTLDLSTADGFYVNVTGTTSITSFGTESAGIHYLLRFAAALTLTYNATSLILPGAANIVTAAGDTAWCVSEGSGNWRVVQYTVAANSTSAAGVPTGMLVDYAASALPAGYLECDGSNVSRTTYATLFATIVKSSTVTITIASPGVVSWTAHGLSNADTVKFSTTGSLPTGLIAGTQYFVVSAATNSFSVAATEGGSAIVTTGSQSGTHTAVHAPWGAGDGSTTFGLPDSRRRSSVGRGGTLSTALGARLGATGGEESHTMASGELVGHTHTQQGSFASGGFSADHTHNLSGVSGNWAFSGGDTAGMTATTGSYPTTGGSSANHTHSTTISGATTSTGSGTAFNVYHPVLNVTKLIKT